ncbi:MAG: GH116 family glycosyl-hydrolase [Anaerolineae bacterium]
MKYRDDIRSFTAAASALAFPLGGIGTGNVSLGARGEFRDWELYNRPHKGLTLPITFFAIRVGSAGQQPTTRVLEGALQPPYHLSHGYHPMTTMGLPRLKNTQVRGEYPFVSITFDDPALPVNVELEAFTPLIPLNPDDSGIPCAIMTYTVTNPTDQPIDVTIVGTVANPVGVPVYDPFTNEWYVEHGRSVNTFRDEPGLRGIYMTNDQIAPGDLNFGSAGLVTNHEQVTFKRYWARGSWWDYLQDFWDDLDSDGALHDADESAGQMMGLGSLGLIGTLQPGESKPFRFMLTWFFPNRLNTWDASLLPHMGIDVKDVAITRNHYAIHFDDAWEVAQYLTREMPRLEGDTRKFHDALFGSSLPPAVIDALSANIVPVRSTTCFWLEDGRFFGWEGTYDDGGCCAGNCAHVWTYAFTPAYLFPTLEQAMRRIEFTEELEDSGLMHFRAFGTFHGDVIWGSKLKPAVDGQMGSILRAYREWLLSGDRDFLAEIWQGIKRAISFAAVHWDPDGDGILEGIQHNTYDIEFYGANALCGIYYLAALRAVEELACVMGEDDYAQRARQIFERGSQRLDELLWNGEFFIQVGDNIEQNYQYGIGCLSDQLLGQLHARVLDLGSLLPDEHIRTAIKSIYDNNFLENFSGHVNPQRAYAFNDEAGLLLCTWPNGGRPRLPFPYSDEVWTGIEYQVAADLIYEGFVDEGLRVAGATRERHDGIRRNPWNEVECGNHYARSMSSWTLLLALTGMHADMGRGEVSFAPVEALLSKDTPFRAFWSTGRAWGVYTQQWNDSLDKWQSWVEVLGGDGSPIRLKPMSSV